MKFKHLLVLVTLLGSCSLGWLNASDEPFEWDTQAVIHPIAFEDVIGISPYSAKEAPRKKRAVEVDSTKVAAFAVESLGVFRVRSEGKPWFFRVTNHGNPRSKDSQAWVQEHGYSVETGVWYLQQPPYGSGVWVIGADQPTKITVERADKKFGRLIWETIRRDVIRWINGGPEPKLPQISGISQLESQLWADHLAASRIIHGDPELIKPAKLWQKASALSTIEAVRDRPRSIYHRQQLVPESTSNKTKLEGLKYAQVTGNQQYTFTLSGPGILEFDYFSVWDKHETLATAGAKPFQIEINTEHWQLADLNESLKPLQVRSSRDGTEPFPKWLERRDKSGSLVSKRIRFEVPLLAGTHEYHVSLVSNSGRLRVRADYRRPLVAESLLGKHDIAGMINKAQSKLKTASGPYANELKVRLSYLAGDPPVLDNHTSMHPELAPILIHHNSTNLAELTEATLQHDSGNDWYNAWLRLKLASGLNSANEKILASRLADSVALHNVHDPTLTNWIALYRRSKSRAEPALGYAYAAWERQPMDDDLKNGIRSQWKKTRWRKIDPQKGFSFTLPSDVHRQWVQLLLTNMESSDRLHTIKLVTNTGETQEVHFRQRERAVSVEARVLLPAGTQQFFVEGIPENVFLHVAYRGPRRLPEKQAKVSPANLSAAESSAPLSHNNFPKYKPATIKTRSLGTLSTSATYGKDNTDDIASDIAAGESRKELKIGFLRRIQDRPIWIRVHGTRRKLQDDPTTEGYGAEIYLSNLLWDTSLTVNGSIYQQDTPSGTERADRLSVKLSKTVNSTENLSWIGISEVAFREYTYDTSLPDRPADPLVYTNYGKQHSRALRAALVTRWKPFQDALFVGSARVVLNEDLDSVDHFAISGGWRMMLPKSLGRPYARVRYRPSYRLRDEHRSNSYIRHDFTTNLTWSIWTKDTGRFLIGIRADSVTDDQTTDWSSSLTIGYDFTHGRGLRDYKHSAIEFDDWVERRQWSK